MTHSLTQARRGAGGFGSPLRPLAAQAKPRSPIISGAGEKPHPDVLRGNYGPHEGMVTRRTSGRLEMDLGLVWSSTGDDDGMLVIPSAIYLHRVCSRVIISMSRCPTRPRVKGKCGLLGRRNPRLPSGWKNGNYNVREQNNFLLNFFSEKKKKNFH